MPYEEQLGGITETGESPKQRSDGRQRSEHQELDNGSSGSDFLTPDKGCDCVPRSSLQT